MGVDKIEIEKVNSSPRSLREANDCFFNLGFFVVFLMKECEINKQLYENLIQQMAY